MTPAHGRDGGPARRVLAAVLDDYQQAAVRYGPWSQVESEVELHCFQDHLSDRRALIERLEPFEVVCLMRERTPLDAALIDALPNLKLIVTTAMWNASLDVAHAVRRGIVVSGTQSIQSGTPELTWLLVLALARRFEAETASVRSGGWQTSVGVDLRKRTIGLLGLGTIGVRVAKVADAFGMRVLAWSQNLTRERAAEAGAEYVDRDTLLRDSDFVSLHLRLSARTRHLIGARELALMKPQAFLVNTSRGPLVDERALIDALVAGRIAGAGLDVFDVEPLPPDHPLRRLPNVVALPHVGYVTEAGYRLFFTQIVEAIRAWLDGHPIRRLITDGTDAVPPPNEVPR